MSTRKIVCGALTVALALAAPLAAQEKTTAEQEKARRDAEQQLRDAERQMHDAEKQLQEAARKMAELQAGRAQEMMKKRVVVFGDNARLGLVLRTEHDSKSDALGATVQALTPGGPAEEAGLKPGDVIVKFNGEPLASPGTGEAGAGTGEGPTDRLMERAAKLKEGETVTLDVLRGGKASTYTVTARRLYGPKVKVFSVSEDGDHDFDFDFEVPEPPEPPEAPEAVVAPGFTWVEASSAIRGLEMVTLNPDLGAYFGTAEGILVVRIDEKSPFKLKAGDVILKIGDRTPTSPSQALRILRSYGPGETVPMEVMRNRQRTTVSTVIPERHGSSVWFKTPAPVAEAPDAPPVPPAPPKVVKSESNSRV